MPKPVSAVMCLLLTLVQAGCGEPGSPQPPSLNLPLPVRNLTAQRTGDTVHLAWTSTDRTTDHTRPSGPIITRICRVQGTTISAVPAGTAAIPGANPAVPANCERIADGLFRLGIASSYDDLLPVTMTTGSPTLLTYYVELINHGQKSDGSSNAAYSAEGASVPPLTGLMTTLRSEGVLLHWDKPLADAGTTIAAAPPHDTVRIERLLQSNATAKAVAAKTRSTRSLNPLGVSAPSPRQTLELPETGQAEALDRTAAFGQSYEYRAQRVQLVTLDGHGFELLGQQSAPVTMQTLDTFPPAIPQDLAAAADSRSNAIDLSWSADTEPDLAGYIVYRHVVRKPKGAEQGVTNDLLQRISGSVPLATPAYHDMQLQPGITYAYSVSAIDQSGNESGRSVEAQETLTPSP